MNIREINKISYKRYGTTVQNLPPCASLWLAEYILETLHQNVYREIWNLRERLGKYTVAPSLGSPIWANNNKVAA
jgi:hypothetical protein